MGRMHPWRRGFVGFVSCAALTVSLCSCKSKPKSGTGNPPAPEIPVAQGAASLETLPSSPIERRAALAAIYRPRPDRRVLAALRDIERILTGHSGVAEPTAAFDGKSWVVKSADHEIARLSEIPLFEECMAACVAFAGQLEKSRAWKLDSNPPAATAPFPFDPQAFDVLTAAQASWAKEPTRGALHDAARGMVALAMEMSDSMGLGDDLSARARSAATPPRRTPASRRRRAGPPSPSPGAEVQLRRPLDLVEPLRRIARVGASPPLPRKKILPASGTDGRMDVIPGSPDVRPGPRRAAGPAA